MKKIEWKRISKKKIIKLVVIGVILIGGAVFAWKKWADKTSDDMTEVMTAQVVKGDVQSVISGKGTLKPMNQYEVKSLVKGEILKAPFKEGETVKKGALLYQISTNEISTTMESAELGVEKAQKAYDDLLLQEKELSSNLDQEGYIKKLHVKKGDMVQAGTVIADIYNSKQIYLEVLFPASEVNTSWIGKKATVILDSSGEKITGVVKKIDGLEQVLDGGIVTKQVKIEIKNPGGLRAGDMAEAIINNIQSNNSGALQVKTEGKITAKREGKIEALYIKEGEWVKKNSPLMKLSSKDMESQIDNAKTGIKEAENALNAQKEQLKSYFIKAPISGEVITKSKKKGDIIDPSSESSSGAMAIIYDLSALNFQMNVDEMDIRNIKVGQKVTVMASALPDDSFSGVVEQVSMKGTTNNGITTYPVIIKIKEFGNLLPGMNVTGKIVIEEAANVLTVPSSCLQRGNILYVKSKEAKKTDEFSEIPDGFKEVEVTIGINDGDNVEIKKGVKEGEEIYIPYDDSMSGDDMYGDMYGDEMYEEDGSYSESDGTEGTDEIDGSDSME